MQREESPACAREFTSSQLKRAVFLSRGPLRLKVEPDSSLSYLHSSRVGRLLFGRGNIELYKVQAGHQVPLRQKETRVRLLSPTSIEFYSGALEQPQFSCVASLRMGSSVGYTLRTTVLNRSGSPMRIRALTLSDPSSLNFRREGDPPGDIGMNAFNRGDHLVMDDAGDTTGARVIGFSPRPSAIYMSRDKGRALDLMAVGELPVSVSGLSGQVIALAQQETEVPNGGSVDFLTAALYDDSSLELALSELRSVLTHEARRDDRASGGDARPALRGDGPSNAEGGCAFRCSSTAITFAFAWAKAALDAIEGETDTLEKLSAGVGLCLIRPEYFELDLAEIRSKQRRDGFISRGSLGERGVLETALFILDSCHLLALRDDSKLRRRWYPSLRKAGLALISDATQGLVFTDSSRPEGWRRRLRSGFPTGATSEVNVVVAGALNDLSNTASAAGRADDSAAFRDANLRLMAAVKERLTDDKTGRLSLNIDFRGRVHTEPTVDQAVALSYYPYNHDVVSATIHRLLQEDFECGLGPRCVPITNTLYYNPTYGEGQLGSCWTRASLSLALLAYKAGYPNIGALQVARVARLVHSDWDKLGGVPGEFPYWFDEVKRKVIGGQGSDPVAAARFVESILLGEFGITGSSISPRIEPAPSSQLRWALVTRISPGGNGSTFVGRSSDKVALVATNDKSVKAEGSLRFQGCTRPSTVAPIEALVFSNSSSIMVCVGCSDAAASARTWELEVPVGGQQFSSALFVVIEEFDSQRCVWSTPVRRRLLNDLRLRGELEPGGWKAFRLAPATNQNRS